MNMSITAFNPPLGPQPANPAFYSPSPSVLQMKEKILSLSGDDFTITTTSGAPVCKCKGKVFSIHGSKAFTDMQGNELFTLKKKMLAISKSFVCESPQGFNIEVKGHFSIGSSKSSVHFKNAADGQEIELDLKGDWFDRSATITLAGRPVAKVSRKMFNVREIFGDKQTVSCPDCVVFGGEDKICLLVEALADDVHSTLLRWPPMLTSRSLRPFVSVWMSGRMRSRWLPRNWLTAM
jgi:uncharacterized protein YxjI